MGTKSVAIVGGGIAGLAAAQALKRRGFAVTIFDESVYLGGKLGAHCERLLGLELNEKESQAVDQALSSDTLEPVFEILRRRDSHPLTEAATSGSSAADSAPGEHRADPDSRLSRLERALQAKLRSHERNLLDPQRIAVAPLAPAHGACAAWGITNARDGFSLVVSKYLRHGKQARYEISDGVYHEHCYHMFLGWYLNFWAMLNDIDIFRDEDFSPRNLLSHLFPGSAPLPERKRTLRRVGSIATAADNLLSGTASVSDLFLWMYSSIDLMSQQFDRHRYLDTISVNGFMSSRWYATDDSAQFHEYLLVKAFAVPTYFSSAEGYGKYLEYTAADTGPMLYVLKGDTFHKLFEKIEAHLTGTPNPVRLLRGARVLRTAPEPDGRMRVDWVDSDIYRAVDDKGVLVGRTVARDDGELVLRPIEERRTGSEVFDAVVLAVPPGALAGMADQIRDYVPGLASVRVLQSGSTAALDLYFKCKLPDLPREHVVCRGSRLGLTFIDDSQAWENDANFNRNGQPITCLNVAATEFYKLDGMPKPHAMEVIIADLQPFIDFDWADIDFSKTYLQLNQQEPLFLDEVGSERWRPSTHTEIPNLFLAGDFCDNPIGVVCVEGAVVSGLLAARAVQAYVRDHEDVGIGDRMLEPIEIREPYTHPRVNAQLLKLALAPFAAAAKAWSIAEDLVEAPEDVLTPRAVKALGEDLLRAPGAIVADALDAAIDGWRWWWRATVVGDDRERH